MTKRTVCCCATATNILSALKVIYRPAGKAGEYARFAANFYNGCSNNCDYCYLKRGQRSHLWSTTPTLRAYFTNPKNRRKDERDLSPERFAMRSFIRDSVLIRKDDSDGSEFRKYGVFFSFSTDPMLRQTWKLTMEAAYFLSRIGVPVTILTKQTDWMERDVMDVVRTMASEGKLAIGFTLTGHDEMEPNASNNASRIQAMETLKSYGVHTFASIEPIIDWKSSYRVIKESLPFVDHYMIGLRSGVAKDYYTPSNAILYLQDIKDEIRAAHRTLYFKDSVKKLVREALIEPHAYTLVSASVSTDWCIFA